MRGLLPAPSGRTPGELQELHVTRTGNSAVGVHTCVAKCSSERCDCTGHHSGYGGAVYIAIAPGRYLRILRDTHLFPGMHPNHYFIIRLQETGGFRYMK